MVREASTAKPGGDKRSAEYQTNSSNRTNGLAGTIGPVRGETRSYTLDRLHRQRRSTRFRGVSSDAATRSEEHTSELQSRGHLVCRLLLAKKKTMTDAS